MDPNSPESLNIAQQMNELLKERIQLQKQLNDAMGASAAASDAARQSTQAAAEATNNANQSMNETIQGSGGLADAMGRSSEQSAGMASSMGGFADAAGKTVAKVGALGAGISGLATAKKAALGTFAAIKSGLTGMTSIMGGAVNLVGGFFKGLFEMAVDGQGGANDIKKANEEIRDSFGDLSEHQGKFVKDMAGDLMSGAKTMQAAGSSMYEALGGGNMVAAALKEVTEIAKGFGNQLTFLQDQIKGATFELYAMSKGMGLSADSLKNLGSIAKSQGGSLKESLQETAVASAYLSKRFGVDVKIIGKNMDEMTKDMESFGHLGPKALAATATYAAKLGVEISALKGVMDTFDTFEGAAEAAGKLNEALGMNIDTMGMMNAETQGEQMDMLRKSFQETGKSFDELSRHEKKLMAQTLNMDMSSLQNAMSVDVDEMGFGDVSEAAEEAAEKMSPEEAMAEVAKSIKKMADGMGQLASGPFANFVEGFKWVVERSPVFRSLMSQIRKWLGVFKKMGKEVGHMFNKHILTPGNSIVVALKDMFSIERVTKFKNMIVPAFEAFFKLVKTDPKKAIEDLFDKVYSALQSFAKGSGPGAASFGKTIIKLLEGGLKLAAGLIPKIMGKMAEFIRSFTKNLKDFISGDKKVNGELGDGLGAAFMMAFEAIKESLVNDLGPALLDLFKLLVKQYWKPIAMVIGGMFTLIFLKSLTSALFATVGGALIKGILGKVAKVFGGTISDVVPGQGDDTANAAQDASSIGEKIADGINEVMVAIGNLNVGQILKSAFALTVLAAAFVPAMYLFTIAIKNTAEELKSLSWDDLGKALAAIATSTLVMIVLIKNLKRVRKKDLIRGGIALVGIAAFLWVITKVLPDSIVSMVDSLGGIDFKIFMKVLGMIAMASLVIVATAVLCGMMIADGGTTLFIGGLGMVAGAAFLWGMTALHFGVAIGYLVSQFDGVDILRAMGVLLTIGIMAPVLLIAAIAGALLFVGMPVLLVAGLGIAAAADFLSGSLVTLADALRIGTDAFSGINLVNTLKMVASVALICLALPVLMAVGAAFVAIQVASFGFGVAAMEEGVEMAAGFAKTSFKHIADIVRAVNKVPIKDPDAFQQKMSIIADIVKSMGEFLKMGVGMAAVGAMSAAFDGPSLESMVKQVNLFIKSTMDALTGAVISLVDIGKSLSGSKEQMDSVKIVAEIIAAIAQFAGALSGPLTKIATQKVDKGQMDKSGMKMRAFTHFMGKLMESMKTALPGLVEGMIEVAKLIDNPKWFKTRVEALKVSFDALISLTTTLKALQELSTDKSGNIDTNKIYGWFSLAGDLLKSWQFRYLLTSLKEVVEEKGLFPSTRKLRGFAKKMEYIGDILGKVYSATSAIASQSEKFVEFKSALEKMQWTSSMPSDIVSIIAGEVSALGEAMQDLRVDMGKAKVKAQPLIDGLMNWQGQRTIVVRPEAVNMHLKVDFEIDATQLAMAMHKGTAGAGEGIFQLTRSGNLKAVRDGSRYGQSGYYE